MKKLTIAFLFLSATANATGNSGLNRELLYIYGLFVVVAILIVAADRGIKYFQKKLKEHKEKISAQIPADDFNL